MQLKEFIEIIEKNKITIIRTWINSSKIKELIDNYSINEELFIKRYSFGFLEHYIKTIKNDEKTQNSAVVIDFLKYLKKQNLGVNELFVLFIAFKDALVDFAFKNQNQSLELFQEINFYFQKVFLTILDIYSKSVEQVENALTKSIDIVDRYVNMSRTNLQGIITSVSSAFCKISGYEAYELIGKSHNIIRHQDMPKELFEDLWKTIKSGNIWHGIVKNNTKDGNYYWVNATAYPSKTVDGKVRYISVRVKPTEQEILNALNLYSKLN